MSLSDSGLSGRQVDDIISLALAEDLGEGDVTSEALVSPELRGKASVMVKENGILAGNVIAKRVFWKVDFSLNYVQLIEGRAGSPQLHAASQRGRDDYVAVR
jgi:nicotinate-nucleotide pyrophosphorylase